MIFYIAKLIFIVLLKRRAYTRERFIEKVVQNVDAAPECVDLEKHKKVSVKWIATKFDVQFSLSFFLS